MNRLIPFRIYLVSLCLLGLLWQSGCAPSRIVRPLERGQSAVNGHLGGPMTQVDSLSFPLPLTSIGMAYGLSDQLTAYGHLHLTAASFRTLQLDAGVTYGFSRPFRLRPGISVSPSLNFMAAPRVDQDTEERLLGGRLYPQLDAHLWWEYGRKRHVLYTGLSNWFELRGLRAHEEVQPQRWIPSIMLGHTFTGYRWDITLEARQIAPHISNENLVVNWQSITGGKGATGLYIGFIRKW
ncbi:MAG: hypothetical protein AAFR61_11170 [Bacteroidota bacterium]